MTEAAFFTLTDDIQLAFDAVVDSGSEQELFISGYLNGHFSLVVSQCLNSAKLSVADLDEAMQASLSKAFADGELELKDQEQVKAFWQNCLK